MSYLDLVKRQAASRRKSWRRKRIVLGTLIAVALAWHLVPVWRQNALESARDGLAAYRRAHGRFPTSQAELDNALDQRALARRGCYVAYHVGPDWDSYTVTYREHDGGKGCTLHFNHVCFCDFPDQSRYESCGDADGTWDEWGSWCD